MNGKIIKALEKFTASLSLIIIATGALLRIFVYVQNRSLHVDEANVARNVFERNFLELLSPLDYQQFAPPGFLWILKVSASIFGYSEYGFRLFPLVCSIVSILLLFHVLRNFTSGSGSLYALFLFATGHIYLYYSAEIKQYASDVAICLSLILFAVKTDIFKTRSGWFFLFWFLAGLFSMWLSMPAVFMLAGVGLFYFYEAAEKRSLSKVITVLCICIVWILQFLLYYFFILKKSVDSDYLKAFHSPFYPELIPANAGQWQHNGSLYLSIVATACGDTTLAIIFNLLLFTIGIISLLYRQTAKGVLLITPVICLYIAAGLHQFTLLPRVVLFIMPVLLLIIALGFNEIFNTRYAALKVSIISITLVCVINFNQLQYFYEPLKHEEFKDAMDIVQSQHISEKHFHVNSLLEPVHIYYTKIHPQQNQWQNLKDADILPWAANYDSIAQTFTSDAVIYAWMPDDKLNEEVSAYRKYCNISEPYVYGMKLYICKRK